MIFFVFSIIVPLAIFFGFPPLLARYVGRPAQDRWLLAFGCVLFFISWYLPSPPINGQDTQFSTHFVGGGIFTGLLWLYLKRQLNVQMSWWVELGGLYALVSALGVANELFEFTVAQAGLATITSFDTWWDLLANTLGAMVFWMVYRVTKRSA